MKKDSYLVSIIIPTFKRPGMLARAIESCLKQTYKNIEILVVDDNNPDTEGRIETEKFMQQYNDVKQIRYIKCKQNGGGAVARNEGIKNAKGYDDAYYNPSCFMLSPQLGVNYQLNDKTSMYLTVGCLVRDIVETAQYHNHNNPNQYEMNAVRSIGDGIAMKMSVGVTF